jgi:hypothetical protein
MLLESLYKYLRIVFGVCLLCMTTSCIKYYDLAKSEFPQGEKKPDKRLVAKQYRRTQTVYDEFETKAVFNALWLSDALRTAYVDVYSHKRGFADDAKEEMLKRQLEENQHWLSFYLLADIREKTYVSLSDPNAGWNMYAVIDDGKKLVPESIKEVDLEPEYQFFFGRDVFNLLKAAYLVKFPISPDLVEKITKGNIDTIQLVIGSAYKDCTIEWTKEQMNIKEKVVNDEDYYWG